MIIRILTVTLLLLAGCAAGKDADSDRTMKPGWPSLAPRVGEVSPLVPRVPLGACMDCGPDGLTSVTTPALPAMIDLPAPTRSVLPANIDARLLQIENTIARIENEWPAVRARSNATTASAGAGAVETEANVQASRFEALFQPLGLEDAALSALEVMLHDAEGADAYAPRVEALRARLVALEAIRARGLNE